MIERKSVVAHIELRIGDFEVNLTNSVYQIIEQRGESEKKGKKGGKKTSEPDFIDQ